MICPYIINFRMYWHNYIGRYGNTFLYYLYSYYQFLWGPGYICMDVHLIFNMLNMLKIKKHQVVRARKKEITSLSLGCKIRAWSKVGEAAHKKMLPTPPSLLLYLYL